MAADKGFVDIVSKLLELEVEINVKGVKGFTPLHYAVLKEHRSTVELLLAKGANLDTTNEDGLNPLHLAAKHGNTAIIETLLNKSDNPQSYVLETWEKKGGLKALDYAAEAGNIEAAKKIFSRYKVKEEWKDKDGSAMPLLHVAILEGWTNIIEGLCKGQASNNNNNHLNIDELSKSGKIALHIAAEEGSQETLKLLIKYGANIHAKNKEGNQAIHLAVKHGNKEVIEELITADTNINAQGKLKHTPSIMQ
jgi:ankyrin repeat protein